LTFLAKKTNGNGKKPRVEGPSRRGGGSEGGGKPVKGLSKTSGLAKPYEGFRRNLRARPKASLTWHKKQKGRVREERNSVHEP